MIGDEGVHGADDGDVIGVGGGFGEEFADFETALAVALEFEGEGGAGFAFGAEGIGERLAGEF